MPNRDYDWALSLVAMAAAASSAYLLTARVAHPAAEARQEPPVGTVAFRVSEVRRRPAGSLVWDALEAGQRVFDQDSVFVPRGSAATLALSDGARLDLEENTLIVVERAPEREDAVRLSLRKGALSGTAGARGLEVRTPSARAALSGTAEARLSVDGRGSEVAVMSGVATVESPRGARQVERDQVAAVSPERGIAVATSSGAALLSPARHFRFYPSGERRALALKWQANTPGELLIQVAADREFREVRWTAPGAQGELSVEPGAGTYWWRAVDAGGRPESETRTFVVVEESAPSPVSPGSEEVVQAPGVRFAWSSVASAAEYEVQISADADFARALVEERAFDSHLGWQRALPDGRYFWRVRAVLDGHLGPWSKAVPFRLVERPLPDAPQLINPIIEVDPGGGPKR